MLYTALSNKPGAAGCRGQPLRLQR